MFSLFDILLPFCFSDHFIYKVLIIFDKMTAVVEELLTGLCIDRFLKYVIDRKTIQQVFRQESAKPSIQNIYPWRV